MLKYLSTIIMEEPHSAGRYTTTFDGNGLASGVYVCRLQTADFVATRKLVLLRQGNLPVGDGFFCQAREYVPGLFLRKEMIAP
jgi:hypothetical protein